MITLPPSTPFGWALALVAVAALVGASRRRGWEGKTAAIWWREQRMHRRPWAIWGRHVRVLLAACLVAVAVIASVSAVLAIAAGLAIGAVFAVLWFASTSAAGRLEPSTMPIEDGRAELVCALGDGELDREFLDDLVDGDVELEADADSLPRPRDLPEVDL